MITIEEFEGDIPQDVIAEVGKEAIAGAPDASRLISMSRVWMAWQGDEVYALWGIYRPHLLTETPCIWLLLGRDFRVFPHAKLTRQVVEGLREAYPKAQAIIRSDHPKALDFAEFLGMEKISSETTSINGKGCYLYGI